MALYMEGGSGKAGQVPRKTTIQIIMTGHPLQLELRSQTNKPINIPVMRKAEFRLLTVHLKEHYRTTTSQKVTKSLQSEHADSFINRVFCPFQNSPSCCQYINPRTFV